MAQAYQPPQVPFVQPVGRKHNPANVVGMTLIFLGFFVFMFGTLIAAVTEIVHPILMAVLGFGLMFGGGAVFAMADSGTKPSVPPPPPTIQPPPGSAPAPRGAIEIPCPNCGAPPQSIDRFGVATCPYCQTRYLVR